MGADPIDWEGLAKSCGTLQDHGEIGGDRIGREAIAQILGEDALTSAVDHYVHHRRGSALARSVLGVLCGRPERSAAVWKSMQLKAHRSAAVRSQVSGAQRPGCATFFRDSSCQSDSAKLSFAQSGQLALLTLVSCKMSLNRGLDSHTR